LRVAQLNSGQKRNEIGALSPELGLRDVPGDLVQRRRRGDHGIAAGVALALPLIEAPRGEVLAVARTPRSLLLRAKLPPALRRTRAMAIAYARVNTEPVAALAARALLRHPPIVTDAATALGVDCFWRADPD
jgi:hypothetical protein